MKCARCNRPIRGSSIRCLYCGGEGVRTPGEDSPITCPGCAASMTKEDTNGLVIDHCAGCGGTWYDRGELERALQNIPPPAEPAAESVLRFEVERRDTRHRRCPRCSGPMTRRNYEGISGVILDICTPHGLFVDQGELAKLHAFVHSGGREAAEGARTEERARNEAWKKRHEADKDKMSRRYDRTEWDVFTDIFQSD